MSTRLIADESWVPPGRPTNIAPPSPAPPPPSPPHTHNNFVPISCTAPPPPAIFSTFPNRTHTGTHTHIHQKKSHKFYPHPLMALCACSTGPRGPWCRETARRGNSSGSLSFFFLDGPRRSTGATFSRHPLITLCVCSPGSRGPKCRETARRGNPSGGLSFFFPRWTWPVHLTQILTSPADNALCLFAVARGELSVERLRDEGTHLAALSIFLLLRWTLPVHLTSPVHPSSRSWKAPATRAMVEKVFFGRLFVRRLFLVVGLRALLRA